MTPDSKAGQCANTGQLWNAGGGIRAANRPATTGSRAASIPISTRLFHRVNNNISFFGQPNKFQGAQQSSHFYACYPVVLWYMSTNIFMKLVHWNSTNWCWVLSLSLCSCNKRFLNILVFSAMVEILWWFIFASHYFFHLVCGDTLLLHSFIHQQCSGWFLLSPSIIVIYV